MRVEKETAGQFDAIFPISLSKALRAGDDVTAWQESGAANFVDFLVEELVAQTSPATPATASSEKPQATRVGGNPEVVSDGGTGYLVESDHEREMADTLLKLLRNDELRQTMGQAGQRRVNEMFTLEKMVKNYTDLYYKVCES